MSIAIGVVTESWFIFIYSSLFYGSKIFEHFFVLDIVSWYTADR